LALLLLGVPALASDLVLAQGPQAQGCCPLAALMAECPMALGAAARPALQLANCEDCCTASNLPALPTTPTTSPALAVPLRTTEATATEARITALTTKVGASSEAARRRLAAQRFATGSSALLSIFLI
jgi:hypothetical protein